MRGHLAASRESEDDMSKDLIIFHGLFGGWGWERLDSEGAVVAESYEPFETREECIEDAHARAPLEVKAAQVGRRVPMYAAEGGPPSGAQDL
jgi:hypothetical protein